MTNSNGKFFYRSLSPCSFERLRQEDNDYFYKPKRGPSTSKSNITITRPIKTIETVTNLVDLLSKGSQLSNKNEHVEEIEILQPSIPSHYSSLLSMDGADLSSTSLSAFSSRSDSLISTMPESELPRKIIEKSITELPKKSKATYTFPICRIPAMGLNITTTNIHLVLLELYPQNVDKSIIIFQHYLISLISENEHDNWSISNVELQTKIEQEANFRLFTFNFEQFDQLLKSLQYFIQTNSSLASSFVLNIALTGDKLSEYERKISSYLNKINLNFDIIQSRAETYMIGLDFFVENNHEEFIEIFENNFLETKQEFYPYLLIHVEVQTTIFYIVHSSNQYSILTTNNLCYQTFSNLLKLLHPNFDHQDLSSSTSSMIIRRPPPTSFDDHHYSQSQVPLTSLTRIPLRYFPSDYSRSKTSHYIYRGWSNRQTSASNPNLVTYDVPTQTDDSFIESSTLQTRLAMHRSLLSMFTMNIALIIKLLIKIYPNIQSCILIGEFFQLEKQSKQDLAIYLRTVCGRNHPPIIHLQRESLISAFGCVLPRVYFDILDDERILSNN